MLSDESVRTRPDDNFQAAYERVLMDLGIWKPGEKCEFDGNWLAVNPGFDYSWRCGCGYVLRESTEEADAHDHSTYSCIRPVHRHDLPPPELTDAVAMQLVKAALDQGYGVYFDPPNAGFARSWVLQSCMVSRPDGKAFRVKREQVVGSSLNGALILALAGAGQGAHERS